MPDVFPDPRVSTRTLLEAAKAARWPTATIGNTVPAAGITVPHIQYAWDGSPSEQVNRQITTMRFTCWGPRLNGATVAVDLAQLVRAVLIEAGSSAVWRYRRGPGPVPGTDQALELPFATFTLTAETRPTRVA